jgi:hypothetical protein
MSKGPAKKSGKSDPNTTLSPVAVLTAISSVSLVMIVIAPPTFLLILFGLAPTWVAFVTDRSHGRARAFAIGTFNLAGTVPFFVQIWRSEHQMDVALKLLSEPMSWLIMYGAASIALVLVWIGPSISSLVMEYRDSSRAKRLGRRQTELLNNWGAETKESATALLVEHGYLRADPSPDSKADGQI